MSSVADDRTFALILSLSSLDDSQDDFSDFGSKIKFCLLVCLSFFVLKSRILDGQNNMRKKIASASMTEC